MNLLAGIPLPGSLQVLKQHGILVVIPLLIVPFLAACTASQAAATQAAIEDQVETVIAATMQALPSSTPEPTVAPACPEPAAGTQLLRNEEFGYCFLFPDRYERLDPLPYEVCLVPAGPSMACHGANLIVEVHDASVRTVAQIVDQKIDEHPQPELIQRTSLTVGGEDAVLVDGLSAVSASRNIFIVHEGRLYDLLFIPWDKSGDGFADLETLYTTIIDSFTFVL